LRKFEMKLWILPDFRRAGSEKRIEVQQSQIRWLTLSFSFAGCLRSNLSNNFVFEKKFEKSYFRIVKRFLNCTIERFILDFPQISYFLIRFLEGAREAENSVSLEISGLLTKKCPFLKGIARQNVGFFEKAQNC